MERAQAQTADDSWQRWSTGMAAISLAVMALWLILPARATEAWLPAAYALWAFVGFGWLMIRARGYKRIADWVTALRLSMVVVLFGLFACNPRPTWPKLGLAALALVLDGVDGKLARRFGPTRHGAVFDMESDAFFVLTLCGIAYLHLELGPWVLWLAALRPLYVFALMILQRFMPMPSPNHKGSMRGKIIHVTNVCALLLTLTPLVPVVAKMAATGLTAVLLTYSFGIDFYRSLRPSRQAAPQAG